MIMLISFMSYVNSNIASR